MADFKIAETDTFIKKRKQAKYARIYSKITDYVYPILRKNPYYGPNIKKLKGEYKDVYRYRVGNYRLFYKIEEKQVIVLILTIEDRKDAYKQ